MRKQVIVSDKVLIKFLNSNGIAKRLKFLARTLMLDDDKRRIFRFNFKYKTGSYTDGKDIYIGVPEYCVGHTKEEVYVILKALVGHEVEHINSSSFDAMKKFIDDFAKYFEKKYDIHKAIGTKVAAYINNCIEDGRIERISSERNPGLKNAYFYHRTMWWSSQDLDKSAPSPTGDDNYLFDTLFAVCTIATMSQYPLNFLTKHMTNHPEIVGLLKSWEKGIYKCVDDNDADNYFKNLWELIYVMEDWLVEQMKKLKVDESFEDAMKALIEESGIGEVAKGSSNPMSSKGKSPSKPIKPTPKSEEEEEEADGKPEGEEDDTKSNDKEQKGDDSSSLRDMFDDLNENGGEDGDMLDVVKDAMKNLQEEILEDEGDTLIQAELEDLKEEEAERESMKGLSKPEETEIRDYYGKKKWDTSFKVYKNNYSLRRISDREKAQAKKMKEEFQKIFLNKVSSKVSNRRKGILDTSKLHRVIQNEDNVFMKKGKPNRTDYVFYLLIDGSGSMSSSNKFMEAYRASSILEECLKEIAPLKITQFDCSGRTVNHYVVKGFDDNKSNVNYSTTFALNSYPNNCNMDGFSIRVAATELLKRNEAKKVLIVLSDGLPSGDSHDYYGKVAQADVKEATRYARKNGIDVFNIMFGREEERMRYLEDFKYMYEKGIINCNPKDISNSLLKIVRKELLK